MKRSLRELAISVELHLQARESAKKEYADKLIKIETMLTELRSECPHPKWNYFAGSGNNDSFDVCDLCGKQD